MRYATRSTVAKGGPPEKKPLRASSVRKLRGRRGETGTQKEVGIRNDPKGRLTRLGRTASGKKSLGVSGSRKKNMNGLGACPSPIHPVRAPKPPGFGLFPRTHQKTPRRQAMTFWVGSGPPELREGAETKSSEARLGRTRLLVLPAD